MRENTFFFLGIVSVLLFASPNHLAAQNTQNGFPKVTTEPSDTVAVPLKQIASTGNNIPFLKLQPEVQAKTKQEWGNEGLRFNLKIANPNNESVSLRSLFDLVEINLENEAGEKVWLPEVRSRFENLYGNRVKAPSPEEYNLNTPFEIVSVTIGQRKLSKQEINDFTFVIPAQSQLIATIAINETKAPIDKNIDKAQKTTHKTLLTRGIYSVQMRLILINSVEPKTRIGFQIGSQSTGTIKIYYGVPNAGAEPKTVKETPK